MASSFFPLSSFLLGTSFRWLNIPPREAWEGQEQEGRVRKGLKDKSTEQFETQEQKGKAFLGNAGTHNLGGQQGQRGSGIGDKK